MPDLDFVREKIIRQTYREVLPAKFNSAEANVLLMTIGLQESRFEYRQQIGGPAHGFFMFERGGVAGVLRHAASARHAAAACVLRGCPVTVEDVYRRIVDDDLLAFAIARLLLWTDPKALPAVGAINTGWDMYLNNWRPGKPREDSWRGLYLSAMEAWR